MCASGGSLGRVIALAMTLVVLLAPKPAAAEWVDWPCTNGSLVKGDTTKSVTENNKYCLAYDLYGVRDNRAKIDSGSDGCSGPTSKWQRITHKAACDDHDACYTTPGVSQAYCDALLRSRANFICYYYPDVAVRSTCVASVEEVYTGLRFGGEWAYANDQKIAEKYCASSSADWTAWCHDTVARNRTCHYTDNTDNRGYSCYVMGEKGTCGGPKGAGTCIKTCDADCQARNMVCNPSTRGAPCYVGGDKGICGMTGADGASGVGICRKSVCAAGDSNCLAAVNRVCTVSNQGQACFDGSTAGACGMSGLIPNCLKGAAPCDASCQEALNRKCTKDNQGYRCYQQSTRQFGVCRMSGLIPDCKPN